MLVSLAPQLEGSVGSGKSTSQQLGVRSRRLSTPGRPSCCQMLCLGRKHPQCSRGQPHRLLDIDQQGIMYKEPIWYLEQKEKAPGCRMRRPFSALNIQDRPEPRSTAGVTSVHSGAPASHKLAPWPPPFSSQSLLTLGMGRGGQQALVMVLIPWSTQLGCATHTDLVLGWVWACRAGMV